MVLADVGLAALLVSDVNVPVRRGRIAFDDASTFTQIIDDANGRVAFVDKVPLRAIVSRLLEEKV